MPDTTAPPTKASVYKTPDGWVAQCPCGAMMRADWPDAMRTAHRKAIIHRAAEIAPTNTRAAAVLIGHLAAYAPWAAS